ncbi:gamma carbonic anhydrase family protein [Litorimonas haliclonae]|uniref:gamma carbonic anhydrase family protein n=1 Tax=Litorimonas haliclonae TaxID=2081977 RepID=UPI0039F0538D
MSVYSLDDITPDLADDVWVAESATVVGNVIMASGSSAWFGTVIRGDNDPIKIGARTNIQDNSVLHSDPGSPLVIGEDVTVGHQAMLHGCTIGDNSLVGIGATILNGAKIGKNCLIGAHALVTENKVIPDNSVVMGSPGKVVKNVPEAQETMLKASAEYYVKNAQRFKKGLKKV